MNLRIKRCMAGLMTWAALTGVAVAQLPSESEGTVKLGQPPAVAQASPESTEGTVILGNGAGGQAPPPSQLNPIDNPGQVNPGNYFGVSPVNRVFAPRFNVDSRGGGLYGYQGGYTTIGAFVPFAIEDDEAIVFIDGRGLVTYDNQGGGANVGAGWRWYMKDTDRLVGLSAWYDNSNGGIGPNFNQIGLSFESLGRYVDYRINGYIPAGNNNHVGSNALNPTAVFSGSNLGFLRNITAAQSYTGFDIETGGPLPIIGRYGVNGYIGGYHFMGAGMAGGSFTGVSGRFMAQINEDVSFGMQMTSDHTFGLNTQFQVFVALPDGTPSRWMRNPSVQERLTQSVYRQFRAITHVDHIQKFESAIDPKDNLPYFVAQIDPNAAATGNGTIETPFNSIAAYNALSIAQQKHYDIIYVRPDTTGSTHLDTAATLNLYNGQRLLSTSVAHTFTSTNFPGVATALPGFTSGGGLPNLFNSSGGNVVTFAPGNTQSMEVSGFQITGSATGNGIVGTNNTAVSINNNDIHNALNGVLFNNMSGTITAGTFLSVTDNSFHDNVNNGFQVTNAGAAALDVSFIRNTFNTNGADGLRLDANAGSVIGGNIGGFDTAAVTGPPATPAVFRSNTFNGNTGNGAQLTSNGGTLLFMGANGRGIINNTFTKNGGDGLHIETVNASGNMFDVEANKFGDPTVLASGNTGYGLNLLSANGDNIVNIGGATTDLGNQFVGNVLGGINFGLTGTNLTATNIQNNTINFNSTVSGSTILAGFNASNLPANDDGSTGLTPIGFNADFFGVNFNQVFVNNNGNITLNSALFTYTPFPIITTGIPMIAPFFADVDTRSGAVLTYGTGTFNGHLAWGVNWPDVRHFDATGGGNAGLPTNNFQLVLVDRSDIAPGDFDFMFNYKQVQWEAGEASGSNPQGLWVGPNGGPARAGWSNGVSNSFELPGSGVPGALIDTGPTATALIHNSLNSNLLGRYLFQVRGGIVGGGTAGNSNGITISTSDTAHLQTSNISQNTASGVGGYGLQLNSSGSSTIDNLTVTQNTFSKNDGGMQINRSDSSTIQALITNNVMQLNGFNGLNVNASGTNVNGVTLNMADNNISQNIKDGFNLMTADDAVTTINSTRDNFSQSGIDNFEIANTGRSVANLTFANVTGGKSFGNGLVATSSDFSTLNLTIFSPTDPLFTGTQSTFSTNAGNGMVFNTNGSSLLQLAIDKADIDNNTSTGLTFNRGDASLVQASITNVTMNSNKVNGFLFHGLGSDPQDPTQPFPNTPNLITMFNDQINQNGNAGVGNGMRIDLQGDSELLLNATTVTFNNNAENGIRIAETPGSQFGYLLGNQRSTFDNVTVSQNGSNGIFISSDLAVNAFGQTTPNQADSLTYMEINSDSGNTVIASNGLNGILMQTPGGTHDLLVVNKDLSPTPTFTTKIISNTQDGIHVETGGSAVTSLTVDGVQVGGLGATDGNGDDGIDFEVTSQIRVVDGASTTNWFNQGGGDGNLAVLNTAIIGNKGNGINLIGNALDGAGGGARTQDNDFFDSPGFLTATVSNTLIQANTKDGVNVDLQGLMQSTLSFDKNVIVTNGQHGFFLNQNPGIQFRGGNDHRRIQFQDPQPTNPTAPFNPDSLIGTSNWNEGNNTDLLDGIYLSNYMNLRTDLNTSLVFTNNVVQFNGTSGVLNVGTGDGVYLRVGTDSKLTADIQNNTLAGNLANDLHIESFVAYNPVTGVVSQPGPSVAAAAPAFDVVFLDDTAQMDLRLVGNTGNTVNIVDPFTNFGGGAPGDLTPNGAWYPGEVLKNNFGNNPVEPRLVQLFQVDDGNNLNATNNFTQNGNTVDLVNEFIFSEWHLRSGADPAFPNPAFPLDYNSSPGNPFLP